MKQILVSILIVLSLCGLKESQARPQISPQNFLATPNYQLMPPFIPIRIAACPTCGILGYRPMEMLPGSFPFIPTASNANINGNILTDRVPGAWSSFPALNRPPQPVQLPTSTLISALISYINYLRQNLDSVANANNCSNLNPLDMSTYNTINQPTLINSGDAANQMLTSAPSWPWTSIQSKPVSNNNATTQN